MLFRRSNIWWYDFSFRNQRIRESTHSRSKTVAREAEQQRRRDLERGIHNITEVQQNRTRAMTQDDRKPEETVLLNGIPYAGDIAASRKQKSQPWKWLTAVSVLTCVFRSKWAGDSIGCGPQITV
jgi:hypothetical protein